MLFKILDDVYPLNFVIFNQNHKMERIIFLTASISQSPFGPCVTFIYYINSSLYEFRLTFFSFSIFIYLLIYSFLKHIVCSKLNCIFVKFSINKLSTNTHLPRIYIQLRT